MRFSVLNVTRLIFLFIDLAFLLFSAFYNEWIVSNFVDSPFVSIGLFKVCLNKCTSNYCKYADDDARKLYKGCLSLNHHSLINLKSWIYPFLFGILIIATFLKCAHFFDWIPFYNYNKLGIGLYAFIVSEFFTIITLISQILSLVSYYVYVDDFKAETEEFFHQENLIPLQNSNEMNQEIVNIRDFSFDKYDL
ncbi:hypothetical protein A3Q56_06675 [Intoshia linei]|uniref:Transmembrane protein n=1 Tax=Intoshia linei TaxID=1819745 RepID=A0A177AUU3_9BILA|nr:hypothetical protein A3Q56_06675 [Intoshia linei]